MIKRKWRTTCKYRSPVEWAGNGAELSFPRSSIEAENRYSKLTENEQKKPLINRNGNGKWQENGSGVASLVSFSPTHCLCKFVGKFLRKTATKLLFKLLFMWVFLEKQIQAVTLKRKFVYFVK